MRDIFPCAGPAEILAFYSVRVRQTFNGEPLEVVATASYLAELRLLGNHAKDAGNREHRVLA